MSTMTRVPLMILAFVLSLVLWAYVEVQEKPLKKTSTSYQLHVDLKNVPPDLVPSQPEDIKVFPIGPREEVDRIDEKDLTASVDMSRAKAGAGYQLLPVRIESKTDYAVKWEPEAPKARLMIQRKKTTDVPVRVQRSGELPSHEFLYLPDTTFTEPHTVRITGPESDVDRVKWARATLDLTRVSPGGSYPSLVELLGDDYSPIPSTVTAEPKEVVIRPAIAVGLQARTLRVQTDIKGQPAPGYVVKDVQISPSTVQVRGTPEVLATMSFVRSKPIDITGLTATKEFYGVDMPPRPDVILYPPTPVTVKVIIEPIAGNSPPTATDGKTTKPRRKRPGG